MFDKNFSIHNLSTDEFLNRKRNISFVVTLLKHLYDIDATIQKQFLLIRFNRDTFHNLNERINFRGMNDEDFSKELLKPIRRLPCPGGAWATRS